MVRLAFFLLFLGSTAFAQTPVPPGERPNRHYTKSELEAGYQTAVDGWIIKPGDIIGLGKGTMLDKSFAYIYGAPSSFLDVNTVTDPKDRSHLPSIFAHRRLQIKNLFQYGNKTIGYTMIARVELGNFNIYWIELDNAIDDQEILPPAISN